MNKYSSIDNVCANQALGPDLNNCFRFYGIPKTNLVERAC